MITLINTNTPLAINSYANSKFNRYNSCVFFLFLLLLSGNKAFSQPVGSAATQAAGKQQKFVLSPTLEADKFHAIIIACSKYTGSKWPALASATADADSLKNELVAEYGFSKQNVVTLYNLNKRDILKGLYKKLDSLGEHDNVVIFYSGHGTIDYATNIAYWVPLNAEGRYDYISNSEITTALANTKAKHV